jgi:RNA polymerase sigma-70 factor (ECF subfamily)
MPVEELDTGEAASCLEISESNVKVRLHRARLLLRQKIDDQIGISVRQIYQFGGERCDRIVKAVLERLHRQFGI